MLHTDALLFADVDPAFRKEGVRVREDILVNLMEDGRHADDGLRCGQNWTVTMEG